MNSNPQHKSLGKPLTNIIRVMQKIEFTTSPDSTTTTPENLGGNIEQIYHDLPTICSCVSNGLLIYIVRKILFNFYDTYYEDQLTILTLYHQNPHLWKCLV